MASYLTETCGLHECPPEGCVHMPMDVAQERHREIDQGLGIPPRGPDEPVRMLRTEYGPHLYLVDEWWTL